MRGLIALLAVLIGSPLAAQRVVVSGEPEAVSLTVYRGQKGGDTPISKDWPTGYALITETRTVTIPAGESVVRFEGVAEGMFPESAIVTGLPQGVKEKNRDARLLSPQGLVDAYLKRQVKLTRTSKATGVVRTQEAFITAGPYGGVILQTSAGYEALYCTGLPERMGYGNVPANLSAKPTLSVITNSDNPVTAKLTLTYMAAGFDWQANYVAQVQERDATGKGKVDLFAWLTLANGGNQSFVNANTMAIAGVPNRVGRGVEARPTGGALNIQCWPQQRTHQVPYRPGYKPEEISLSLDRRRDLNMSSAAEEIMVTGSAPIAMYLPAPVAAIVAQQENLGDLKLYRIPEPVTVNAKGQKQVAMLVKPGASFEHYYTGTVDIYGRNSKSMTFWLRSENLLEKGLGLPMPQGQVMVFEDSKYGPLLTGESSLLDRAVGDEIEMRVGDSSDVRISATRISEKSKRQKWKIEVTNARNSAVNVEIYLPYQLQGNPKGVQKVDGTPVWKTTLPANGDATLYYELELEKS